MTETPLIAVRCPLCFGEITTKLVDTNYDKDISEFWCKECDILYETRVVYTLNSKIEELKQWEKAKSK